MSTDHHAGLEDIEVLESGICEIRQDKLSFRGYNITDLAENAGFEETAFLLWNDALPSAQELSDFKTSLRAEYNLPREITEHINHVPREAHPMAVLRTLISSLGLYDPEASDNSPPALRRRQPWTTTVCSGGQALAASVSISRMSSGGRTELLLEDPFGVIAVIIVKYTIGAPMPWGAFHVSGRASNSDPA